MTNLEAIKGVVGYPMSDNSFEVVLINWGIDKTATYLAKSKEFDLAVADALEYLISHPDITEMGFSMSLSDKQSLVQRIKDIRSKYGYRNPNRATAKWVNRM